MNIIELKAENFKRLEAVNITPDGNVNIISGKNAQGKSSVLDAIEYCLSGPSKSIPRPIKDGESKAKIEIDLGSIKVSRTVTPSGARLVVTAKDGTPYKSPQAVLDELFDIVSFDPVRFINMSEKDQVNTLLVATQLQDSINELESKKKIAYDDRTIVNRRIKDLIAQLKTFQEIDYPEGEELSATDLLQKIKEVNEHNKALNDLKINLQEIGIEGQQIAGLIKANKTKIEEMRAEIERLETNNVEMTEKLEALRVNYTTIAQEIEQTPEKDTREFEEGFLNIETHNKNVRKRLEKEAIEIELASKEKESADLTDVIDSCEASKATILNSNSIGIPLTISEEGILFNGVPLKQCSSAEQLKISMAVAMALQPNLRVILIRDGSLLDNSNLESIKQFAIKHDYQLWIEKVDDTGTAGIIIEEGRVKA